MSQPDALAKMGSICWTELITTDKAASLSFYKGLFGWETSEMDMGEAGMYTMISQPGAEQPFAGCWEITAEMGEVRPHWLSYIMTSDCAASVTAAEANGARILKGVTDVGMGIMAILLDPQGAAIAFWEEKPCD